MSPGAGPPQACPGAGVHFAWDVALAKAAGVMRDSRSQGARAGPRRGPAKLRSGVVARPPYLPDYDGGLLGAVRREGRYVMPGGWLDMHTFYATRLLE